MRMYYYWVRTVKIRPRKACKYPNLRSFGWVSYDKVGVLYSRKLGNRSQARASDLITHPELWWNRIKLRLSTKAKKVSTLRGPAQLADLQGARCCVHPPNTLTYGVVGRTSDACYDRGRHFSSETVSE